MQRHLRNVAVCLVFLSLVEQSFALRHPDLERAYQKASCAVVKIVYTGGMGTGFFISPNGDILTAAHVALNRRYSIPGPNQIGVAIDYKPGLRIMERDAPPQFLSLPKLGPPDVRRAAADLAVLRTGLTSPCYLRVSKKSSDMRVGTRVISIGYPLSAPNGALYEGFISAVYQHLRIPIATVRNIPIFPAYKVIRLQMPITPGASGSPVIADDGKVIGVISENPALWFNDLNALIHFEQVTGGGFNAPVSDMPKMVAKLAWVVREFETSGAGLAVPVSYLEVQEQKKGPPGKRKPQDRGSGSHHR